LLQTDTDGTTVHALKRGDFRVAGLVLHKKLPRVPRMGYLGQDGELVELSRQRTESDGSSPRGGRQSRQQ
jgi:hypothetical protein